LQQATHGETSTVIERRKRATALTVLEKYTLCFEGLTNSEKKGKPVSY